MATNRASTEAALLAIIVEHYGADVIARASEIKWFLRDAVNRAEYARRQLDDALTPDEMHAAREEDSEDVQRANGTFDYKGGV